MNKLNAPKVLTLTIAFLSSFACYSQVAFHADCTSKNIGINEFVQVQFLVDNAVKVDEISPPVFKGFEIISGPVQQSGMTNNNGTIKRYIGLAYVLRPLSPGKLFIGAASATADGKEYHSEPFILNVSSKPAAHPNTKPLSPFSNLTLDELSQPPTRQYEDYILKKGEKAEEKIKKNLFARLEVSRTSCYIGDPLVATYKLYSRLRSESNVTKTPSFNGFSVVELGNLNGSVSKEIYNGREYDVYLLRKVELYPLQSGKFTLEPTEVENKITFITAGSEVRRSNMYDLLRDMDSPDNSGQIEKNVILKSNEVAINVLPLPEAGKPADFRGAVGSYKIGASVTKHNITTNDADSLMITIEGSGNIQMINAPHIIAPDGLELFDPRTKEVINKKEVPLMGIKTFTYPFSAQKSGNLVIPTVSLSYFDLATRQYITISTKPIILTVTTGHDKKGKSEGRAQLKSIIDTYKFIIVGIIFILACLVFGWKRIKKKDLSYATLSTSGVAANASQPLAEAGELMMTGNIPEFYMSLKKGLLFFLSSHLNITINNPSGKELSDILMVANIPFGLTLQLSDLIDSIDARLNAEDATPTRMHNDYEKACHIISLLNSQKVSPL